MNLKGLMSMIPMLASGGGDMAAMLPQLLGMLDDDAVRKIAGGITDGMRDFKAKHGAGRVIMAELCEGDTDVAIQLFIRTQDADPEYDRTIYLSQITKADIEQFIAASKQA